MDAILTTPPTVWTYCDEGVIGRVTSWALDRAWIDWEDGSLSALDVDAMSETFDLFSTRDKAQSALAAHVREQLGADA